MQRFADCRSKKSAFLFTIDPFGFEPDGLLIVAQAGFVANSNLGAAQLALLELQSDIYLRSSMLNRKDCLLMWKTIAESPQYQILADIASKVMSMFGSTYRCEAAFSALTAIKSKQRNRLTDLNVIHCLRAATTSYQPNFTKLVSAKQCHATR